MKIRNGFVANSSSSSFYVIDSRKDKTKDIVATISLEINLSKFKDQKFQSIKELNEYKDCLSKEGYNKLKNFIDNGSEIIVITVCNDSRDELESLLYYLENLNDLQLEKGLKTTNYINYG